MSADKRQFERKRIPEDRLLPCEAVGGEFKGHVSVLGPGGAFIRTHDTQPVGTALELRIQAAGELVETRGIVRDVQPGGVGVAFTRLGNRQKETIHKILAGTIH